MPCQSCDMEDRRQSLGKAQAQRWLFPTSSQVAAGAGKNIVSAGECRTIGQQLADFVQILDETPSVRFLISQDTIDLLHLEARSGEGFAPWTKLKHMLFDEDDLEMGT